MTERDKQTTESVSTKHWSFTCNPRAEFEGSYIGNIPSNFGRKKYYYWLNTGGIFGRFDKRVQYQKNGLSVTRGHWKVTNRRRVDGHFELKEPATFDFIKKYAHGGADFEFTPTDEITTVPEGYEHQQLIQ